MRDANRWRTASHVPQGETGLLGAWTFAVTEYPPQSMTIWLKRIDPQVGSYELLIPGEALTGNDFPDRRLYQELRRQRRQPSVAERFSGRIRALAPDGNYLDIGAGEVSLPPEPNETAAPWSNPQNPWAASAGWPSSPPWGGGPQGWPPWNGGGYGQAWPGGYGMGGPMQAMMHEIAELKAKLSAQPPAVIAGNPELVELWKVMHSTIEAARPHQAPSIDPAVAKLLDLAFARLAQTNTPASSVDPFSLIERVMGLAEKFGSGGKSGGITLHTVDGATLLEKSDGTLDVGGSVALSLLKDSKAAIQSVGTAIRARAGGQGQPGGPARPGAAPPAAGPRPNGAAPAGNGAPPRAIGQ
jgi:hypothetical protein